MEAGFLASILSILGEMMKRFFILLGLAICCVAASAPSDKTACPPFGLCVPVEWHRNRDGDTPEVKLPGGSLIWAIRLKDCWAPELHRGTIAERKKGTAALEYANKILGESKDLRLFIPIDSDLDMRNKNLLKSLTFDRIPGYVFVGPNATLNRMLVDRGLASTTKHGELGE